MGLMLSIHGFTRGEHHWTLISCQLLPVSQSWLTRAGAQDLRSVLIDAFLLSFSSSQTSSSHPHSHLCLLFLAILLPLSPNTQVLPSPFSTRSPGWWLDPELDHQLDQAFHFLDTTTGWNMYQQRKRNWLRENSFLVQFSFLSLLASSHLKQNLVSLESGFQRFCLSWVSLLPSIVWMQCTLSFLPLVNFGKPQSKDVF